MAEKEYIERGALLKKIEETFAEIKEAFGTNGPIGNELRGLLNGHRIVRSQPAADVAPVVHAEWIPHEHVSRSPYARNYDCSACGNSPIELGAFCNNCGAKMDGERYAKKTD